MAAAHILVVDDEPDIRDLVKDVLEDEGYRVSLADSAEAARRARSDDAHDAVLLDIWMPGEDGISLLRGWSESGALDVPVVMMSGHGTVETAVEATRLGAYDFIEKPIALAKLLITLERALEASALRRANAALHQQVQGVVDPVGDSPAIQALRAQIERLAALDTPVLLQGEPGTGKEALARWMHARSGRRHAPFVVVSPGSIAAEQAAIALFGAEGEGAEPGLLAQAQGGTLFLDEVAELPPELQLRLSSVLERRALLRVGGSRSVPLDVRLLAATAADLEGLVRAGRFREELFYQLAVVPLQVPPLRDRVEDIPMLLAAFADHFARRDRLPYRRFPIAVQNRLRRNPWPGNLRELRTLVQRLLIMGHGEEIELAEVEAMLGTAVETAEGGGAVEGIDFSLPLREARDQFERAYLLRQLAQAGGSVGRLAKMAGMERTHLYRKLRDLGVDIKSGRGDGD